ncbi:hypothetical protein [Agrococcus sp. TF02-05]|uniref:hypothetical protein n=1 Tax=Agrococcus sp. TF02-05 TaxID=2815211 RepID=UPI001AA0E238|nr:hypothetical protein [Agrococcus sp. TF02-05]MBO1770454.1 hypothetical protein [Agrococcus sp. TF02-05]
MPIIRNIAPNPSIELNAAGYSLWTGSGTLTRIAIPADAPQGNCLLRARATASQSNFGIAFDSMPLSAGPVTVAYRARSNQVGAYVRTRFEFRDAGGSLIGAYLYAHGGTPLQVGPMNREVATVTAPAGSASMRLVAQLVASTGFPLTVPADATLDLDAVIVAQLPEAPAYFDGDSPGWVWDGAPHASASLGPDGIYTPEAQLLRAGTAVDWIDLVPGYEEAAAAGTVVQVTADPARAPYVTVRPGRDARGTLTMHFVRETGKGRPGDRAEAAYRSLSSGAPHTLQMRDSHGGLGTPLQLVPAGAIRRTREARSDGAWTVEFDFHRTVVPT